MIEAIKVLRVWLRENKVDPYAVEIIFKTKDDKTRHLFSKAMQKIREEATGQKNNEEIKEFSIYGVRGYLE